VSLSWDRVLPFILRPVILVVLLVIVAWIGAAIRRRIPEGRVKEFLTQPVNMWPKTEAERRSWFPFVVWVLLALIIWVPLIFWAWWMDTPHPHHH
jgi:hypothetical protein